MIKVYDRCDVAGVMALFRERVPLSLLASKAVMDVEPTVVGRGASMKFGASHL
jgi:hypothetical protein